jgi:hypothetical protein
MPPMRLVLDDCPCETTACSVREAVDAAAALAAKGGRRIVEIHVDGRRCSPQELDSAVDGTGAEVRVTSVAPREFVGEVLSDAARALTEADMAQRAAAEALQAGDRPAAMTRLDRALGLWRSVHDAVVDGCRFAGIRLDADAADGALARSDIALLRRHLQSAREALQRDDPSALADTLLYDLPAAVERWQAMLLRLRERLAEEPVE